MKPLALPLLTTLLLAACAGTPPAAVPRALVPGPDETFAISVAAAGVQVYECRPQAGGEPQWVFVAPEAALHDGSGRTVGSHGAGPHWLADDGSRVDGRVTARSDAPAAGAIPWLLLATRASGPQGRFSGVTSIQRVNTVGGAAPEGGCDAAGLGSVARVPYRADYRLFRAAPAERYGFHSAL